MGHVEFGKWWRIFDLLLAVSQTKTKKRHLITVTFAALGLQVARVIPPLSLEIRMGVVIRGKRKLSPRQRELVSEATLTLPSPWQGEGKDYEKQKETQSGFEERL